MWSAPKQCLEGEPLLPLQFPLLETEATKSNKKLNRNNMLLTFDFSLNVQTPDCEVDNTIYHYGGRQLMVYP